MALETGEKLYLPVESKTEQTKLKKLLLQIRDSFKGNDAIEATKIVVYPHLVKQDKKYYVILEKRAFSPLVGFVMNEQDAELKKVMLSPDRDIGRSRRIRLMIIDGYSKEEIDEAEDGLTPEEIAEFFPNT
jgi:hypothetical protein